MTALSTFQSTGAICSFLVRPMRELSPDMDFKQPTAFSRRPCARGLRYFPLKRRGGRSAETALVRIAAAPRGPPRGRADLRFAGDRRSMTGAPPGAPPRRFLSSGHASRQTTFDRDLTSASSWRGALSGAQVGSEGLPGPGLRDLCAGAASCSISKTPPEDALSEQGNGIKHIFLALVKH